MLCLIRIVVSRGWVLYLIIVVLFKALAQIIFSPLIQDVLGKTTRAFLSVDVQDLNF